MNQQRKIDTCLQTNGAISQKNKKMANSYSLTDQWVLSLHSRDFLEGPPGYESNTFGQW